ncbi:MAG: hypothetical protein ACQEV7_20845 [Bacillota bacterium]
MNRSTIIQSVAEKIGTCKIEMEEYDQLMDQLDKLRSKLVGRK